MRGVTCLSGLIQYQLIVMWDTQRALSAVFIRGVSRERETEKGKDNISCRICPCLVWARWKGVSPETLTRVSSGCQTGRMGYDDITWLSSVFVSPAFFYQFAFRARLTRMKIFLTASGQTFRGNPTHRTPTKYTSFSPSLFHLVSVAMGWDGQQCRIYR